MKIGLAAGCAISMFVCTAACADEQAWIEPSWVPVREAPSAGAKILGHWTTNTAVRVTGRTADWCAVGAQRPGSPAAGHVPCAALGKRPVTLREIHARMGTDPTKDLRARAYWVAPSAARLADAGRYFNYYALSAEQAERERRQKAPLRFLLPEFETMKRHLAAGVVPVIEQELDRLSQSRFVVFDDGPRWRWDPQNVVRHREAGWHALLPTAKVSAFKRHADILLASEAQPDAVAAMLGQPSVVRYSGEPKWIDGHHDSGVAAIWDIAEIHLRYAKPVVLHSLSHRGLLSARQLESGTIFDSSFDDGCQDGYPVLPEGRPLPGYPRFKEQPLVSFVVAVALPSRSLDVISRKIKIRVAEEGRGDDAGWRTSPAVLHTVDFDRDGAPDLAVIETNVIGSVSGQANPAREYYININGEWWAAGWESVTECT